MVVTFVEVTSAKFPFQRKAGEPRARVASRDGRKFPVEVPPANWSALVVVFPAFVTVWRSAAVDDGQFVPFCRHTFDPFT